jgi:hypothetical protein
MLQGNFATKKVTSLKLESNSVEPSAFFPQRNKVLVEQELSSEVKATSENVMDFADSHKTKGKTAIARISTMQSMMDFSSLCINIDTIIHAICSNNEPQPIFRQILLNFVAIVNNQTGYVGLITLARCRHFIGTAAVSSSKNSTALRTLLLTLETVIPDQSLPNH